MRTGLTRCQSPGHFILDVLRREGAHPHGALPGGGYGDATPGARSPLYETSSPPCTSGEAVEDTCPGNPKASNPLK